MEKQDNNRNPSSNGKKKITSKQIVALVGVALLVLLYIVALIMAIVDNSDSGRWFMGCIFATMAVPLLIWIYTWLYGRITGKHTIADAAHSPGADSPATLTNADGIATNQPDGSSH